MSRRFADAVYRLRFVLTGISILGAVLLAPRANITDIDNDITAWFSKDDPVYRDYERFREEFAGTRTLIVALQADSPSRLFSRETLDFIGRITADIERVDTVQRVDSLASATIVDAVPDGLDVRPLIDLMDRGGPDDVRRRALEDELIRGDLVSEDATVAALIVSFDEDRIDAVRGGIIQRIHDIVDPGLPPGVRSHYNGSLEISETYNRITLDNQRKFTPPILLFTVLAIYATFRSIRKTALALFAVGVSVLWTLGLYSLLGFTYNVLASMIVPLIVVLAIADDVHIMQHWDEERRVADAATAFRNTVAHLTAPLFGASVTTALGMLSLASSDVVAVRSFGIGSAIGVMVDFAISLTLMPTVLSLMKPETGTTPHEKYLLPPLRRVAQWSTARPALVFTGCIVACGAAALGMLKLRVDTNHINFFSPSHPIGQSAAIIDSRLAGVYSFQIMLEGPPDSLKTPDALQRIDRLAGELRRAPFVRKVTSVADYVKRIHRELSDGAADAAVIPADADTIAQELLVFTLGGEGRHELERIVASDFSRAQISIKLQSMSSDLVLQQVEQADVLARRIFEGSGISVLTTGSGRLFSTLDHYLVTSQATSFATAFVTVFGVIFLVFRSFRFGLLSIVPNLLPVISVLGIMGHLDISLNIATVMVASVALGVVDDDTIHFINRYRREVAAGATSDAAIATATAHEGRASLTTAIINSCGYGVLLMSEYKPTAWFGGLLALTMAVAFLAEVLILPATIKLLPRMFGEAALRRTRRGGAVLMVAGFVCWPAVPAQAQPAPAGYVSLFTDYLPNRADTVEGRIRLYAEEKIDVSSRLRLTASGFAEGLLARRPVRGQALESADPAPGERETAAVVRLHDAHVEFSGDRGDLLVGLARIVWGRLDEVQPTDVVNPLDVSRFFFDGRSEARLPVAAVRGRVFLAEKMSLEAVYVPLFRRGRFDQIEEGTAPFGLDASTGPHACPPPACQPAAQVVTVDRPDARFDNAQGGVRFNATSGRTDWSVSAFRGFEPFALYRIDPGAAGQGRLAISGRHPRFTMIGGDFETVRGPWGIRGEVAAFVDDSFQTQALDTRAGSSIDAGAGVDRSVGDVRISATVLFHQEQYDLQHGAAGDDGRRDLSLVFSTDRTFARERYRLRGFAVANTLEGSGFVRGIAGAELADNVALEGSAGWFIGRGADVIGRYHDRDFLYLRLKYSF